MTINAIICSIIGSAAGKNGIFYLH